MSCLFVLWRILEVAYFARMHSIGREEAETQVLNSDAILVETIAMPTLSYTPSNSQREDNMRQWQLPIFFVLAWIMTPGPWQHAPAAFANDQIKMKETEAPETVYAATPQHVVNLMLELAEVKKTDLLYDLGCGDGRIAVTAAKNYGCKALGVDIDPDWVRESLANVKEAQLEHLVTIEQKDIFDLDLSEADVVAFYLLPELVLKLIPQLKKMKPGSRVVSSRFDLFGIESDTVVTISSRLHGEHKIYLWTLPLHDMASTAQASDAQRSHLRAVLTYVTIGCLGLAAFFWFVRKHLGIVKINIAIDRGRKDDDRDTL